ncbi:sensor histidine kinase [Amycolatopsis minnesotensis]
MRSDSRTSGGELPAVSRKAPTMVGLRAETRGGDDFFGGSALAPRLSRLIVGSVFTCLCVVAFLTIVNLHLGDGSIILALLCMGSLLLLQMTYVSPRAGNLLYGTRWYAVLLAQACLVYLPMFLFGQAWVGMPGFFAGSALLVLPVLPAAVVFALVVLSMAVLQLSYTGSAFDIMYTTVSTVITGLVVYGLSRLANLVAEVHAKRMRLAELAVAEERLRFARDLHDLLGYSLSAITLKSELAHRVVLQHPARAQDELSGILDIARTALADVRTTAAGYREMSLEGESDTVRSVLAAADVQTRMDIAVRDMPPKVGTVLATVLREGVTNLLRHSNARHCEITVRRHGNTARIDIVNDGVLEDGTAKKEPNELGGSGIRNLSRRVSELDGELLAGVEDGRFRLRASVPLPAEPVRG